MTYYGIIDKIKREHIGVYAGHNSNLVSKSIGFAPTTYVIESVANFFGANSVKKIYKAFRGGLINVGLPKKPENKTLGYENSIIIPNENLGDNYRITEDLHLFYGLFNDKLLKNNAFKKIMKSNGGSVLQIIERDKLPKELKHYGGTNAIFNKGIYCTHPKDSTTLIPLNNSNNLIKTLILEETISAYEALGAKKMIIKDVTSIKSDIGGGDAKIKASLNGNYEKSILREKHFGKGIYDPNRAKDSKMFIYDFPSIMTTINSRINGNQTIENFTENINLSIGLDVDILNLFQANSNFEYNRIWNFEVEFYDKNEL